MRRSIDGSAGEASSNGDSRFDEWEVYARLVLQHIDPETYKGLSHSDRPDLVDHDASLGVEVTQALPANEKEAEALYASVVNVPESRGRTRRIERMGQLGAKVYDWGMFGPTGTDSFALILDAFRVKTCKLNDGYAELDHNHLFVLSSIFANDRMLVDALGKMVNVNQSVDARMRAFEKVVVSVPGHNYVFDLASGSYSSRPFVSRDQYEIAERAHEIVAGR